jgi:hypothetical protein
VHANSGEIGRSAMVADRQYGLNSGTPAHGLMLGLGQFDPKGTRVAERAQLADIRQPNTADHDTMQPRTNHDINQPGELELPIRLLIAQRSN